MTKYTVIVRLEFDEEHGRGYHAHVEAESLIGAYGLAELEATDKGYTPTGGIIAAYEGWLIDSSAQDYAG